MLLFLQPIKFIFLEENSYSFVECLSLKVWNLSIYDATFDFFVWKRSTALHSTWFVCTLVVGYEPMQDMVVYFYYTLCHRGPLHCQRKDPVPYPLSCDSVRGGRSLGATANYTWIH